MCQVRKQDISKITLSFFLSHFLSFSSIDFNTFVRYFSVRTVCLIKGVAKEESHDLDMFNLLGQNQLCYHCATDHLT